MSLNIGGDKSDASYRYKMPQLVTKIEGRGNGIKTIIVNMVDVAKALHIHPAYPTKYFGIELGAQSKFTPSTERAVVNGAHGAADLSKIIERFIALIILCPVCKLPELKMSVKSTIKIDCAACGHNSTIKTTHKLAQYILKHPPNSFGGDGKTRPRGDEEEAEAAMEGADGKKKSGKKVRKKDKKGKSKTKGDEEGGDDDDDDESAAPAADDDTNGADDDDDADEAVEKESASAPKKDKEKKSKKEKEKGASKEPNGADVWYTDTSKEAQRARKEAEFKDTRDAAARDVDAIVASANRDNKAETPLTSLRIFLAAHQRSTKEIAAELKRVALARGLDEQKKISLLVEALIDTAQPKLVAEHFSKNAAVFKAFAEERIQQTFLLNAVEALMGQSNDKRLIAFIPHVLRALYDGDVLDEEAIVGWFDAPPEAAWLVSKETAIAVRAKAQVFVDWLKTADEDDEEDQDDED